MIAIDTNLLVRHVTRDDPHQFALVDRLVTESAEVGQFLFVSAIVLCETTWVLKKRYMAAREHIASVIETVLDTGLFVVEHEDAARIALLRYRSGAADFSDYLIGEIAASQGCTERLTFDRKLAREAGYRIVC